MTKVQFSPETGARGRVRYDTRQDEPGGSFAVLANLAGALISIALITGIGVWGYKLMVRDVSGIPIVRAAEGGMRVLPDDPGGELARHQGLAVNAIAGDEAAAGPVDQVRLAPAPVTLRVEDSLAPVIQPRPLGPAEAFLEQAVLRSDAPSGLPAGSVTTANGAAADTAPTAVPAVVADVTPETTTAIAERVAIDAPGLRQSIRPRLRPANGAIVQPAAYTPTPQRADIDPAAIPSGTRLAQLGAFDSADVARSEWQRLEQRFGGMLSDKSRVVQKVTSGGRDFYRLRAMGFRDLNDARRFCSALKAEGVDCIPVAAR